MDRADTTDQQTEFIRRLVSSGRYQNVCRRRPRKISQGDFAVQNPSGRIVKFNKTNTFKVLQAQEANPVSVVDLRLDVEHQRNRT